MRQFTVPQFIDVESKIIGPITSRQFVIILGAFVFSGICYKLLTFSAFLFISITTLGISAVFSFAKINGRPFHFFVLNIVQTLKKAKIRVWNKGSGQVTFEEKKTTQVSLASSKLPPEKNYTQSRLTELSLIVDTGGAYQGEELSKEVKSK